MIDNWTGKKPNLFSINIHEGTFFPAMHMCTRLIQFIGGDLIFQVPSNFWWRRVTVKKNLVWRCDSSKKCLVSKCIDRRVQNDVVHVNLIYCKGTILIFSFINMEKLRFFIPKNCDQKHQNVHQNCPYRKSNISVFIEFIEIVQTTYILQFHIWIFKIR